MSAEPMHKKRKICESGEQQPTEEILVLRTEVGHKIESIIKECAQQIFWTTALESMAARIQSNVNAYASLRRKFKDQRNDMSEEELILLTDTACKMNDMHHDVHNLQRKYWETKYATCLVKCRAAFANAFFGI